MLPKSSVALALLVACGGNVGGPIARVEQLTRCNVPSGSVRVYDLLGGDAETYVMHAKIIMSKDKVDAFVQSCGFREDQLRAGYDHHDMFPEEPVTWWNPPDRQLGRGAAREEPSFVSEILVVERDTDFAVYLRTSGRVQ